MPLAEDIVISPTKKNFSPLSSQDVETLEAIKNVALPKDFVSFFQEYGGSLFDNEVSILDEYSIDYFCGNLEFKGDQVAWDLEISELDGFEALVFGRDLSGNLFLLKFVDGAFKGVFFWDHDEDEIYFIADTFEKFLTAIVLDE